MIELRILNGRESGVVRSLIRFPVTLGRKDCDVVLAEPGVWDRHLEIRSESDHRFQVVPQPSAPLRVDGRVVDQPQRLRNGDVLEAGSVRVQFRLSPSRQRSIRRWEIAVWTGLATLGVAQLALAFAW